MPAFLLHGLGSSMIKSFEGIRGVAALIVALYHLGIGYDYFPFIRNGYLFVDLFFVLSGYVMYAAYASSISTTTDLQSFLIRRIGRLVPLLIFSTICFVLIENMIVLAKHVAISAGYVGILNSPDQLSFAIPRATEILSTLTMTHAMGIFDRLILNTPSWSISVEFYAYVLFGALCVLLSGKRRIIAFAVFACIGAAVSIWASIVVHHCLEQNGCLSLTYDFGFPRALYSFFLGTMLALHQQEKNSDHDYSALQWPALAALSMILLLVDDYPIMSFLFPIFFAFLILSICNDSGPLARLLGTPMLLVLGQRSYSIYLMHMPLLLVFSNLVGRADSFVPRAVLLLSYVTILVVVSGWTYRFVEDPLRIRFNRLASRRRSSQQRNSLYIAELPQSRAVDAEQSERA
jgi:peptidoglycan/LPS O-acetylase OafA/YrhL